MSLCGRGSRGRFFAQLREGLTQWGLDFIQYRSVVDIQRCVDMFSAQLREGVTDLTGHAIVHKKDETMLSVSWFGRTAWRLSLIHI